MTVLLQAAHKEQTHVLAHQWQSNELSLQRCFEFLDTTTTTCDLLHTAYYLLPGIYYYLLVIVILLPLLLLPLLLPTTYILPNY